MEREIIHKLLDWYKNPNRKPLVIWGARQIGKTYLVKELFLKENFKKYVYIDLKKDSDALSFFSTTCDPDLYLSFIEAKYNVKISKDVPLVIDEAELCNNVLSSLKYFCDEHRDLPVIVTGSLVRLSILHQSPKDNTFLFPVGKIDSINMHPMTFKEYLLNSNKVILKKIEESWINKTPLLDYEHEFAMNLLFEYLSIGGLPEVVDTFLNKGRSYVDTLAIRKNIYDNYLSDMDTYNVSNESILKTRNVYKNIFKQLNKENKNFKITEIENGRSNRDYFSAYQWLESANIVLRSSKKQDRITLPLIDETENSLFRYYLSDVGLFVHQSNINAASFLVKDTRNTLSGIFFENYVACELAAKDIPLFYWCGKKYHEFEFVVSNNNQIIPIDVKKGNSKMNSLDAFRQHNKKDLAIKIANAHLGYDKVQKILTVPLYQVFMLVDDLFKNIKIL